VKENPQTPNSPFQAAASWALAAWAQLHRGEDLWGQWWAEGPCDTAHPPTADHFLDVHFLSQLPVLLLLRLHGGLQVSTWVSQPFCCLHCLSTSVQNKILPSGGLPWHLCPHAGTEHFTASLCEVQGRSRTKRRNAQPSSGTARAMQQQQRDARRDVRFSQSPQLLYIVSTSNWDLCGS